MPKYRNFILGFTLLELLLVILVIGILATAGIAFYQTQTLSSKINKTAAQMQQISQAAAAYYVDNGCWPGSSQNDNCKQCTNTPPDFNSYLKLGTTFNPFGQETNFAYSYEPEPQNCKKFQVFSGELPAPANDPLAVVKRVIANLPSAIPANISNPPNQVMTETIVPPGQAQVQPNYLIQYFGLSPVLTNGSSIGYSFHCPSGWQVGGFVSPVRINPSDWIDPGGWCRAQFIWYGPGSYPLSQISAPVNCSPGNPAGCAYNVTFLSNYLANVPTCPLSWGQIGTGNIQFLQVGYCKNPNPQGKNRIPAMLY